MYTQAVLSFLSLPLLALSLPTYHAHKNLTPALAPRNFAAIEPIPWRASVRNSCNYPVWVRHTPPGCAHQQETTTQLAPGATYSEPIETTLCANVAIKVANDSAPASFATGITQFEYGYSNQAPIGPMLWYDISLIDCTNNKCPGWEKGLQAVAGTPGQHDNNGQCKTWTCPAGSKCEENAYQIGENDSKVNPPVGACLPDGGVIFELCAANRGL